MSKVKHAKNEEVREWLGRFRQEAEISNVIWDGVKFVQIQHLFTAAAVRYFRPSNASNSLALGVNVRVDVEKDPLQSALPSEEICKKVSKNTCANCALPNPLTQCISDTCSTRTHV